MGGGSRPETRIARSNARYPVRFVSQKNIPVISVHPPILPLSVSATLVSLLPLPTLPPFAECSVSFSLFLHGIYLP